MFRSTLCPLVLILLAACPTFAQRDSDSALPNSSFEISGQVRSADNRTVIDNVMVRLESFSGGLVDQITTDSTGKFRFSRLRRGQYTVTAKLPGFTASSEPIDINRFIPRMYVILQLVPESATFKSNESRPAEVVDARVPEKAKRAFEKARAALTNSRTDEALAHLEQAVLLYPDFFEAQMLLGSLYMDARQWERAERALGLALKVKPKTVVALVSMGEACRRQKKYPEAEKSLQEGLKLDDNLWQGHFTLGRVYWETGQLGKAGLHVVRTLQLNPDYADAHLLAGNLFMRAGRPENALVEYEDYLRLAPEGELANQTREIVQKLKKSLAERKK